MTTESKRPVLFIHGLWLHATSWAPWLDLFSDWGRDPLAPGWPGEPATVDAARSDPDAVAGSGINDVTEHYAKMIADLPRPPVVVGHSFGGVIAQKLLGDGLAAAAIGVDAAQIKGDLPLPLSALRVTMPVFKNPANSHRSVMLDADEFRYGFGNAITREESDSLWHRWVVPSPGRPLFEAARANLSRHSADAVDTANQTRGPLLLITGGQDHTVPESVTRATVKQYRHSAAVTDLVEFPDRGHSLTVDHGWRDIADACLQWLHAHNL